MVLVVLVARVDQDVVDNSNSIIVLYIHDTYLSDTRNFRIFCSYYETPLS